MMLQQSLFIDGQWVKGGGLKFFSVNPASGEIIWQKEAASGRDAEKAVRAAREAFAVWGGLPLDERKDYLKSFEQNLKEQKESLAALISEETGKPLGESLSEVQAMITKVDISFRAYDERCREIQTETEGGTTRNVRFKPHGVVAVFGPFNFPGHLPNGHIIPALLAGNTVVLKPSELTPAAAEKITRIWESTGLPQGVFNLVQGGRETGQALLARPELDGIFFTGSAAAGAAIHRLFADSPEKILALEMGGNNPLVVWNARDWMTAARMTIQSAFLTSGQRCSCARRLIISQGKCGEDFVRVLAEEIKGIDVGPFTGRPEPFMGPLISKEAAAQILNWQKKLLRKGGVPIVEMKRLGKNSAFLTPGLLDVTKVKKRPDVEIFGPLLQVIRVEDFDAALVEANNTVYGLAAGILTDDGNLYEQFFRRSRAGVVNWNRPLTGASSESPFGGVGQSGNHRAGAYFAADYCAYPVTSLENRRLS